MCYVGDIFVMMVLDANVKRRRILVTKMTIIITNIPVFPPICFISNIDVAKFEFGTYDFAYLIGQR